MEEEFIERCSRIKFITRRCPKCGTQCYVNHRFDIVCPNCGIVAEAFRIKYKLLGNYIG